VDTSHQATTLSVQVRVDLLLKGGLVEVTRSDTNTKGNGLLLGLTGDILVDGNGGVDTTAVLEESSDSSSGSLGGNEDDIDIGGNINLGLLLEDWGETVGEVEGLCDFWLVWCVPHMDEGGDVYLSLGDLGLDSRPGLTLGSIGKQVHDDGTLGDGLVDLEESLSWNPAIFLGILPRLTVLSDTDDNLQSLITHVQRLGMSLRTVTNDGHCVILEVLLL